MNVVKLTASDGKIYRRLSDGRTFGKELDLGYTYFLGTIKLHERVLELPEHYEEVDEGTESYEGDKIEWLDGKLFVNSMYMGIPESNDYGGIKTSIIKTKYSNDDQLAILCNRDSGDEIDEVKYKDMQKWRDFASDAARKILLQLQTHQE